MAPAAVIDAEDVMRRFGAKEALRGVSLAVPAGEVHALLGRNGAGKTTLLRVLTGLLDASAGSVRVAGIDVHGSPREVRRLIGVVPSGDRSFYLRLSGLENLVFFARLHGLPRARARERALRALAAVGLEAEARRPVHAYSHGMQKRLSVARALLTEPPVLLVDEATHDLDPEGAARVRRLAREAADAGRAVVWATQRVEEIRGLAERVTLLDEGAVRFQGTVPALLARSAPGRYVLRLANGRAGGRVAEEALREALAPVARLERLPAGDRPRPEEQGPPGEDFGLALADGAALDDALRVLLGCGVRVLSCRQERPEVESAFLAVVEQAGG